MEYQYKSPFPKKQFEETQKLNPYWSSYTCFAETIKNKKDLHSKTISRYFNKLVDKDDYAKREKRAILKFLYELAHKTI